MRSHRRRDDSVGGQNTRSSSKPDRRRNDSRHNDNSRNRNNRITEATHTRLRGSMCQVRNNGQGDYQHGSPHDTGNTARPQLGQDARNTGTAPQPLTVHQPNNGTPPAPASAGGTPGARYGFLNNCNPNARQPGGFRPG